MQRCSGSALAVVVVVVCLGSPAAAQLFESVVVTTSSDDAGEDANRSTIRANAFQGPGGNIDIAAGNILSSVESVIEAVSELGIDGNVEIDAPDAELAGQVTPLSPPPSTRAR